MVKRTRNQAEAVHQAIPEDTMAIQRKFGHTAPVPVEDLDLKDVVPVDTLAIQQLYRR